MEGLEDIWAGLLSGDETVVRQIWNDLTDEDAHVISAHLKRMIAEPEFSAEQQAAARRALEAILRAG